MKSKFLMVASLFVFTAFLPACSTDHAPAANGEPCGQAVVIGPSERAHVVEPLMASVVAKSEGSVRWVDSFAYREEIQNVRSLCPETPISLVGFGDDAAGLHAWLGLADTRELETISAVTLIADPTLNVNDNVARESLTGARTFGDGEGGAGVIMPEEIAPRVLQVCSTRDATCNDKFRGVKPKDDPATLYLDDGRGRALTDHILASLE